MVTAKTIEVYPTTSWAVPPTVWTNQDVVATEASDDNRAIIASIMAAVLEPAQRILGCLNRTYS